MDLKLVQLVQQHGLKWNLIAEKMQIVDPVKVKNRYYSKIKKGNRYRALIHELASAKDGGQDDNEEPFEDLGLKDDEHGNDNLEEVDQDWGFGDDQM
mmetsp:Transcript_5572/g.4720  ORF Transcript_5572/g.4720 Transcript_5572/m.4720 type:complete len:97 (+) Transcript_5572:812-1102(+)